MASKKRRRRTRGQGLVATLRDPDKIRVAYIIAGLALVFGGSLSFGGSRCASQKEGPRSQSSGPGDAIASIEDHKITYEDFYRDYDAQVKRQESSSEAVLHPEEWTASIKYSTLRQMIDMEYFDIKAAGAGITVTDEQVEEKVNEYRNSLMPQTESAASKSILQRIADLFTTAKEDRAFEMKLKQYDPTNSLVRLRRIIRQTLTAQQYVTTISKQKETEIMTELSGRCDVIRGEIVGGLPFSDAAKQYSEHTSSGEAGGLMLGVKHDSDKLPKAVIDSAFSLPVGEVSLAVTTNQPDYMGAWLVTVISRKGASGADWESAKEGIRQKLLEEKRKKVEAGELELPAEGNLVVTDEEVIADYEEATIRVLYLKAEDPMQRVSDAVKADEATMKIVIYDPEIRAMHHVVNEQWDLAAADYEEALRTNAARLDVALDNRVEVEMGEARLRYLVANLWATRAFRAEGLWMQNIWAQFQANPEAFGGQFPELPEDLKKQEQGFFAIALKNIDRSLKLEDMAPFAHWQRAQLDIAREQLMARDISDLSLAHEYSSEDFELEQKVVSVLNQMVSLDDRALEKAGGVRPETWTDPVLPEDEMGLTLESLDAPFIALIDKAKEETTETPAASAGQSEGLTGSTADAADIDMSSAGTEPSVAGESPQTSGMAEVLVPEVPIPAPNGPLTQQMRDQLSQLRDTVQKKVDELTARKEQAEQERQAAIDEQTRQLQPTAPPQEGAPSEEGNNLLDQTGEEPAG